jgi:hypothetical protein
MAFREPKGLGSLVARQLGPAVRRRCVCALASPGITGREAANGAPAWIVISIGANVVAALSPVEWLVLRYTLRPLSRSSEYRLTGPPDRTWSPDLLHSSHTRRLFDEGGFHSRRWKVLLSGVPAVPVVLQAILQKFGGTAGWDRWDRRDRCETNPADTGPTCPTRRYRLFSPDPVEYHRYHRYHRKNCPEE